MAWNDTQAGANLDTSFKYLLNIYNNGLPGHVQQLQNAATRSIKG